MKSYLNLNNFRLESGEELENVQVAFSTYGTLNNDKSNVVWVCHALTANSDVLDWWSGLFGKNRQFDPETDFIICVNSLGSCYGTTGPASPRFNKRPALEAFPLVTTKDAAKLFEAVRVHLDIPRINTLVASSLGGQQAIEWAVERSEIIDHLILIATNAKHSAFGIGFNESQRMALTADPTYFNGSLDGGKIGLAAARSIALLSYRSYDIYEACQSEVFNDNIADFRAASYQRYQGQKLSDRFSAHAYFALTRMMDSHNIGRGRGSIAKALHAIQAKTLIIGIESDQLFPLKEQRLLAEGIPGAFFGKIQSLYGHDGFLIETEQLSELINDFLYNGFKKFKPTVFKSSVKKSELMNLVGRPSFN